MIIFVFFLSTIAAADCPDRGIWALSRSSVLNRNGIIILEFHGGDERIVPGLGKQYPVYLESEKEKVILTVVETFDGEKSLTEVVLRPVSLLTENETYTLRIDGLTPFQSRPERFNDSTYQPESPTYKINNLIDTDAPAFDADPSEQKKTLKYYGCGPASWVYFTIKGTDKSELFVKAKVKNTVSGYTSVYILPVENGVTKVGSGMCIGAFTLNGSDNFEVAFQLYDQSGNGSNWGKYIPFTRPAVVSRNE